MKPLPAITVSSVRELEGRDLTGFTHVLSIWDPMGSGRSAHERRFRSRLAKSAKVHFAYFEDIDCPSPDRRPPTLEHVSDILAFSAGIPLEATVLIHCWAGVSRSTAVAYAILCQHAGPGSEKACVRHLRKIRPRSMPNLRIVTLAEVALGRDGTMFAAWEKLSMQNPPPPGD